MVYVKLSWKVSTYNLERLRRFEKILCDVNDCLRTFSEQTWNCFSADSNGTFKWWTPNTMTERYFKCCTFSLKILLSGGRTMSSSKWLRDLFFNENSNISPVIFHSQPRFEHRLGKKKRPVKQSNFTFHEANVFSLNVRLYIFQKKLILGLKTK